MWTSRHPPPLPPTLSQPAPLTSGWAAGSLTRASVRCPGTPCYYCDLYKRPPTHKPSPHYSQQSACLPSHPPTPSSPPPFIYSGSYTQAGAECVCVCVAHTPFCYPHREAQLGKCAAFIKRTPFSLIKIHRCPFFYSRPQNEMDGWNYCAFFPE